MKLISYFCGMIEEQQDILRELFLTEEFQEFYDSQPLKVQEKFDYVMNIIRREQVLTEKFVKYLKNFDIYEMRVGLGNNEYRSIMFAVDHDNVMQATKVILLNGFLKKSNSDYSKQVKRAKNILKRFTTE